jgi:hypothetical protein
MEGLMEGQTDRWMDRKIIRPLFNFLILYTVDRTPRTGDKPVAMLYTE